MQLLITIDEEGSEYDTGIEGEELLDLLDIGRRHPEDCILTIRHRKVVVGPIQVRIT
jgi:hypothetical protein